MQQEIILTVGLPASGKTTWVLEFLKNNPDYMNVNRDDIRLMLQGRARYNKFTKTRESIVTDAQFGIALNVLNSGKSVIVSDTNLNPKVIKDWEEFAKNNDVDFQLKYFTDIPLGVCLERDAKREFPVGGQVIMSMFEKYQDIYWPVEAVDESLPSAYIVDVDGTIAHMHNRHPYQWDKVKDDLPKQDVIDIVNTLHNAGHKIIICSGRDGISYDYTVDWLTEHGVLFNYFYIRPQGDSRKDYDIKREIYEAHIKGKFNVKGVFDDRNSVVHLWRQLGLTCMQVNYGAF